MLSTNDNKATILALITVLFWSTVPTAFKIGLKTLLPAQLIFIATIVTIIILFVYTIKTGEIKKIKTFKFKHIVFSAFLGFLNPFLYYIILFKAYSILPAQVAQPLNMIWPILLVMLSVPMLKQKMGWKSVVALFISFIGIYFLSTQGEFISIEKSNPTGIILCIVSAFIWSFYWIFNVKNKSNQMLNLLVSFTFGLIYLIVYISLFSSFRFKFDSSLFAGIYIGIFEIGIAFILWLKALSLSSNNSRLANLIYIAPFLSLIFVHFILGEQIYITTILGVFLIISGILFQKTDKKLGK